MVLVGILFFSFLSATLDTSVFPGYDQLEAHISINTWKFMFVKGPHVAAGVQPETPWLLCQGYVTQMPLQESFCSPAKTELDSVPNWGLSFFSSKPTCFQNNSVLCPTAF